MKGSHNGKFEAFPRTPVDRFLESLRFAKAKPHIPQGACLLDIGAGDGAFLSYLNGHIHSAVGIEANLMQSVEFKDYRLVKGDFPKDFSDNRTFDVITMLATVEHIPMDVLPKVADACWEHLKPGGQIVITVPHPRMDGLLTLLKTLRIVEGFSMHQHYGFDPECLPDIFNRWQLVQRKRWGFGCNNLFLFGKS
jgi:2-polyprenyl-3-methyl-5-hydroxy-6-metoxy-1,4-benzoquinol methylase